MTTPETPRTPPPYDAETEVAAVVVGIGTVLTQAFALFPGLLPCLLLLLPFVLPLIVLGLLGAVLFGVPYGIWKLINTVTRPLRSHRGDTGQLVQPGRTSPDSYA